MDEMRRDAETILANTPVTGESVRACLVGAAAERLARAVLGLLDRLAAADDGEPVDEAWLRVTLPNVGKPLQPLEPYSGIYRMNGRWWMTLSLPRGTTVSCPVPATRGAVRRLVAALTPGEVMSEPFDRAAAEERFEVATSFDTGRGSTVVMWAEFRAALAEIDRLAAENARLRADLRTLIDAIEDAELAGWFRPVSTDAAVRVVKLAAEMNAKEAP